MFTFNSISIFSTLILLLTTIIFGKNIDTFFHSDDAIKNLLKKFFLPSNLAIIFIVTMSLAVVFRNFFFTRMFGSYFNSAPSFMVVFISLGTLFGVAFAAKFYRDQAIAQNKQASSMSDQAEAMSNQVKELKLQTAKIEESNLAEQYRIATKMLSPKESPPNWYSGLQFMETIVEQDIPKYANISLLHLIEVSRIFSEESYFKSDASDISNKTTKLTVQRNERHRFIHKVIEAFSRIYISLDNYRDSEDLKISYKKFTFQDVKLPKYVGREMVRMGKAFFQNVKFINCDFSNIEFLRANFINAEFDKNCKFDLDFCFVSLSCGAYENDFFQNKNFKVSGSLYYWDGDVNLDAIAKFPNKYGFSHHKLTAMNTNKFEKWKNTPAPRIP